MQRTRIKICGIRDAGTAKVAADAGTDMIGLVFVEKSPRYVTLDQAKAIIAVLNDAVEPVALFVDAPVEQVRATAAALGLKTVQLHGQESVQYVRDLAPLQVIKAAPARLRGIHDAVRPWLESGLSNLYAVLLDAIPIDNELPGGTGRQFYWGEFTENPGLKRLANRLMIAGGLTPQNVRAAIELICPFAVDVSSGVESRRGVKDHQKIVAFCRAVRSAADHGQAASGISLQCPP